MSPVSPRTFALTLMTPLTFLALAACGGVAVNTSGVDESVSPFPSATSTSGPTVAASVGPSSPGSPQGTHPAPMTSQGSTPRTPSSSHPVVPTRSPSAPHTGSSGGTHTITPTSAAITVTPSTGLTDGQTVTIRGSHFNPSIQVIAVECVNNGSSTQSNNCNINLLSMPPSFYPAPNGTFTRTFTVQKSFSGNTCSAATPCIIAVTQPSPNPSEEADAPIRFR